MCNIGTAVDTLEALTPAPHQHCCTPMPSEVCDRLAVLGQAGSPGTQIRRGCPAVQLPPCSHTLARLLTSHDGPGLLPEGGPARRAGLALRAEAQGQRVPCPQVATLVAAEAAARERGSGAQVERDVDAA